MRLEWALTALVLCLLLGQVISHATNLQESLAVTGRYLGSVVIELAVIDVVFMLRVESESRVLDILGLACCLHLRSCGASCVYLLLLRSSIARSRASGSRSWTTHVHHRVWLCFSRVNQILLI